MGWGDAPNLLRTDDQQTAQTMLQPPHLPRQPARPEALSFQQAEKRRQLKPPDHPAGVTAHVAPQGALTSIRIWCVRNHGAHSMGETGAVWDCFQIYLPFLSLSQDPFFNACKRKQMGPEQRCVRFQECGGWNIASSQPWLFGVFVFSVLARAPLQRQLVSVSAARRAALRSA